MMSEGGFSGVKNSIEIYVKIWVYLHDAGDGGLHSFVGSIILKQSYNFAPIHFFVG